MNCCLSLVYYINTGYAGMSFSVVSGYRFRRASEKHEKLYNRESRYSFVQEEAGGDGV